MKKISVDQASLLDLIHWARRYCDGRSTFAPSTFNQIYQILRKQEPEFMQNDKPDVSVKHWPWAQDGMYKEETGAFDARPKS